MSQKYFCDLCGAPCESGVMPIRQTVDRIGKSRPAPLNEYRINVRLSITPRDGEGRIDLCSLCKKSILAELANG